MKMNRKPHPVMNFQEEADLSIMYLLTAHSSAGVSTPKRGLRQMDILKSTHFCHNLSSGLSAHLQLRWNQNR